MTSRARWLEAAFGAIALAVPLAVGRFASGGIEAACDEGVVRVVGRGYTGALRGLDAFVGASGALVCAALLALATYAIARRAVRESLPGALGFALAVVAAALATTTFPSLREAAIVSGATIGALLVVLPVALACEGAPQAIVIGALAIALTYDFAIAASALAGVAALGAVARPSALKPSALAALAFGAVPVAWMAWRRNVAAVASIDVPLLASPLGEGAMPAPHAVALSIAKSELGVVAIAFAAVGAVVALRSRNTRAMGASALAIAASGAVLCALGAPAGPARFSGALLAALAAIAILCAVGMAAIVSLVARAQIPAARASAVMIVLVELAVPVRVADDASLAMSKRDTRATARWNAYAFGSLPRNAVLLLPTQRLFLRARAAHAIGALADDVIVVPTFGLSARATGAAIAREPLLSPLVRDLALYGAPEEFSLSQLAAARPVLVAFDARWDKRFARHLVPDHAFDRYFVEPRGPSDRIKAFAPLDDADARAFAKDPPLDAATRDFLRARTVAAALTGEREWTDATAAEVQKNKQNL